MKRILMFFRGLFAWIRSIVRVSKVKAAIDTKPTIVRLASNPYLKYPVNEECYCGSFKKYKNCCKKTEPLEVPESYAEAITPLINKMRSIKKRA